MSTRSADELALIASIADDLPAGIWVALAPSGRFVYANRAFNEIMGMGPRSDVGVGEYAAPYGIYTHEGALYPEEKLPFVRALAEKRIVLVDDIAIHRPDGRRVFVRALARPMLDSGGKVTHVAIAFADVTAEIEAQRRAATVEEQLRSVVAHAPIMLFAYDTSGVITVSEGRGLAALGWKPSDFLGRSVFDLYKDRPEVIENARRALAGEAFTSVVALGPVTLETTLTPMRDKGGAVTGVIGVSTDVTERRRMEARLVQTERIASMGTLAASVAHEINNPLSYVISNLEVIALEVGQLTKELSEDRAQALGACLEDAREGAERVRKIVRGLRTFTRGDDEPVRPVDVCGVLDRSISMVHNELRHRARLRKDYGSAAQVSANEGQLSQVFVNLLVNAAHAIPEGHADENEIVVRTRVQSDSLLVEIADTGTGITEEVRPHIFEPFFTTKPVGGGTGLGLSVCLGIVRGFGGEIDVETEVGKGSTFRIRLPTTDAQRVKTTPPLGLRSGVRRRLLIIDDDARVADGLRLLLIEDHDVEVTTSAKSACARLLAGERFDLVFCDLMMPEMNGMDLYAALEREVPEQAGRLVFMTGGAFTPDARAFLERVPNARLDKPFSMRILRELIELT